MSFCCVYISCRISISHSTLNTPVMFILSHVNQCRLYDKSRDVYIQDCDDDGESAAGARLLHLLQVYLYHAHTSCSFDVSFLLWTQMMDVRNGMVVVSRWYVLISIWFAYFIGHAIRTLRGLPSQADWFSHYTVQHYVYAAHRITFAMLLILGSIV